MKPFNRYLAASLLCTLMTACGNPNERLDEYLFYEGPGFKLKVVLYYRNIPFNYLGEQAVVMCQSKNTGDFSGSDPQDSGWRILGEAGGQEGESAQQAALRVKNDYQVMDDHTLAVKLHALNISFDACGSFINWDPSRLPPTMIDTLDKPDSCAPNGPVDCRYFDFEDERVPQYQNITIATNGRVSFRVTSPAFRDIHALQVHTNNNGTLWHVDAIRPDPGQPQIDPNTVRSLPAPLPENNLADASLGTWLESVLPPKSMVIWPDRVGLCGEQPEATGEAGTSSCLEIGFSDDTGNSGELYIAVNAGAMDKADKPSFHSGVYNAGETSREITSLESLPGVLTKRDHD